MIQAGSIGEKIRQGIENMKQRFGMQDNWSPPWAKHHHNDKMKLHGSHFLNGHDQ